MNKVKETCGYESLRKIQFLEIFDFELIYISKSKCSPFLKFLPTSKRMGNGAWLCVSVLSLPSYSNHIPMHTTALVIHYSSFKLSIKTSLLEYLTSHKVLMIFHNDASNSHVLAFLEFL